MDYEFSLNNQILIFENWEFLPSVFKRVYCLFHCDINIKKMENPNQSDWGLAVGKMIECSLHERDTTIPTYLCSASVIVYDCSASKVSSTTDLFVN